MYIKALVPSIVMPPGNAPLTITMKLSSRGGLRQPDLGCFRPHPFRGPQSSAVMLPKQLVERYQARKVKQDS